MFDILNDDICEEILNKLTYKSIIKISNVSKKYYKYYISISEFDIINLIYEDSKSIKNFCIFIIKEECIKYKYSIKKKILYYIIDYMVDYSKNGLQNYIYTNIFIILYNFIILIIHSINYNYKKIIEIFKNIDYSKIFTFYTINYAEIIKLNIDYVSSNNPYLISKFNNKKATLIKISCFVHTLIISSITLNNKNIDFIKISNIKKEELKKNLEEFYKNYKYPKKFLKELLLILDKLEISEN
tara:strand:- start:1555 stop:2280 length:726 start_codon:yes stop_codon:yes gene_type:complete